MDVHIERVRLRWRGDGREARTPATRLRTERLLRQLNLRPPSMASGTTLVIRRLDGLPPLSIAAGLPAHEWERQVQRRFEELYRRASRYGASGAAEQADAVVFLDDAELLAAFTQDVLAGRATRWYWGRLLPQASRAMGPRAQLTAGWVARAAALPAAFAMLPVPVVLQAASLLHPTDARAVTTALRSAYAMPSIVREEPVDAPHSQTPPPWEPWVTPRIVILPPETQEIVGLCAALHAAPAYPRTEVFEQAVRRWRAQPHTPDATLNRGRPSTSIDAVARSLASPAPETNAHVIQEMPLSPVPTAKARDAGARTLLGGVFYLLNVLAAWGPPPEWGGLSPMMSAWTLLELLARGLLAADVAPEDPIWQIVAELEREAGEEHAPSDEQFWLPPRALRRFGGEDLTWRVIRGEARTVMVDEQNGYTVVDTPNAVAQAVLQLYEAEGLTVTLLDGEIIQPDIDEGDAADWWLRRALGFARYALPGEPADWLRIPANILLTRTHIDVYFPLDAINVEVRRAGMDIDPGWLPDFGYIVYFHYD